MKIKPIISQSNDSPISSQYEKEVVSLCEQVDDIITNISETFFNCTLKFFSSGEEVSLLKSLLEELLPYENKLLTLESRADFVRKKYEHTRIDLIPSRSSVRVIDFLYDSSIHIPGWIIDVDGISKDPIYFSVQHLADGLKRTIHNSTDNIFRLFKKINELLLPFKIDEIKTLPISIEECPKVVDSSSFTNKEVKSTTASSIEPISKEDELFLDEVISSF
jgi:hypothetical protein